MMMGMTVGWSVCEYWVMRVVSRVGGPGGLSCPFLCGELYLMFWVLSVVVGVALLGSCRMSIISESLNWSSSSVRVVGGRCYSYVMVFCL